MSKNKVTLKLSSPEDIYNCSQPSSSTAANKIRKVNKNYDDDSETCDILALQFIFISEILRFRNLTKFSKGTAETGAYHLWLSLHKFIQNYRTKGA